jgi:hypothetical protein
MCRFRGFCYAMQWLLQPWKRSIFRLKVLVEGGMKHSWQRSLLVNCFPHTYHWSQQLREAWNIHDRTCWSKIFFFKHAS